MDSQVTPEDIAGMQDAIWIRIGFGPEAADQIGMLAFSQAIGPLGMLRNKPGKE